MSADPAETSVVGARYCYRHPDRETYISCQRCARPICPDCMKPASVGFQCPECVAESARGTRAPRTLAGGLVPGDVGLVTKVLIAINVAVFVVGLVSPHLDGVIASHGDMLGSNAGYRPHIPPGVAEGGIWRLLTAAFVHNGFLHIAFNMYALYVFGPVLEAALGRLRFVALYLMSAVASSAFVYAVVDRSVPTAGASGAIFGLLGAAVVVFVKRRLDPSTLIMLVVINFGLSFVIPRVSWQGHLGGLVAGAILAATLVYAPRRNRTLVQAAGYGVMAAVVVAAVVLRTAQLTG